MTRETCICYDSFGVQLQKRKGQTQAPPLGAAEYNHSLALSSSTGAAQG